MAATKTSANEFYDQWLEQQKTHFSNWTKYSQDTQKSFSDTFPLQGMDAYRKWYDQQFEQFQQAFQNFGKLQPQMMGFPNMNMPQMPFPGAEQTQSFFKDAFEKQQQFFQGLMGSSSNPFKQMGTLRNDAMENVFRLYDNWLNLNRNAAHVVAQSGDDIAKQLPNGVMSESVKNLFASSDVYIKLLELWVPMMKKLQEETPAVEDLKTILSPEKYKEVMDRVFNFVSPDSLHQFYTQASTVIEQLNGNTQATMSRYQEMMAHNSKLLPELMAGDPQAAVKLYENMYEAYSKNLDPQVKSALGGRDSELMDISKSVIEKVTEYVNRYTQFQHRLYVAGQKAMEGAIEDQHKAFSKSGQPTNFSEFFKQWVDKNQAVFAEIFKSKEFTKLQSDLMDTGMDIKSEFQKLMEVYLADYPVVSRSEMDGLYKKIHDLQSKLRKLEGGAELMDEKADAKDEKSSAKARATAKKA